MCWSRGAEHWGSRHLFIPDDRLLALVGLLQDEIFQSQALQAAGPLLWCVFDRVRRKLREGNFLIDRVLAHEIPNYRESTDSIGRRAQLYVDANLSQQMTLEGVARAVFTTRARVSREFRVHTGETFGAYVLRSRLERAKVLLSTTSYSIKGIAWRVGFTDPDYFSTTFRRVTGITPTEFRKKRR